MNRTLMVAATIALAAGLIVGCGEESVNRPAAEGTIALKMSFDLTSEGTGLPNINDVNDDIQANSAPLGDGSPDSVTVSSGLAMVRSLRFVADPAASVDTNITAADEQHDMTDASVRFHGPYVLQVTGDTQELETTSVPAGHYGQLRFVLQKARSTDDVNGHTELVGSSLRVSGTIWRNGQGTDFTYTTDYTSEVAINGSFNIAASAASNLAIIFDAGRWFRYGRGWLDPTDASSRLLILRNLRNHVAAKVVGN